MINLQIEINKETYNRLELERKQFTNTIGGEWNLDDTLNEIFKILDMYAEKGSD